MMAAANQNNPVDVAWSGWLGAETYLLLRESERAEILAVQAVELLFTIAGASAVYASTGLERCLRDVRTAAQHLCVTPTNFQIAGQLTLGLDVHQSVWSIDDRGDG